MAPQPMAHEANAAAATRIANRSARPDTARLSADHGPAADRGRQAGQRSSAARGAMFSSVASVEADYEDGVLRPVSAASIRTRHLV